MYTSLSSAMPFSLAKGNWIDLIDFPVSTRETTFVISCLVSSTSIPSEKGSYSKKERFAPQGSKFFPFEIDPFPVRVVLFSGEGRTILTQSYFSLKACPFLFSIYLDLNNVDRGVKTLNHHHFP